MHVYISIHFDYCVMQLWARYNMKRAQGKGPVTLCRQDVSHTAFCKANSPHVSLCWVCPVPDMVRMCIYRMCVCIYRIYRIYTSAPTRKPDTSGGVAKTSGAP